MNRRVFIGTTVMGLAGLLTGCGGQAAVSSVASSALSVVPSEPAATPSNASAQVAAGKVVKAGWVARTAGQTLWPLAKEAGYFDKYGVNVDLQFMENSTVAIPAMVSGELGPVAMAGAAVVGAQAAGSDIVMIAGLQNTSIFRIMAVAGIDKIEELKGKTVAVVQLGSNDYYIWQRIMGIQKWSQNDLKFASANSLQGQIALLQRGDAQAIAVSPPNNVLAENQGGHQILDTASLNSPEQNLGITLLRSYLSTNRAVALAMLKATVEAIKRYRDDAAFAKGVIRKILQSDDQRVIDAGYDAYLPIFPTEPYPTREGFQETINEIATRNSKAASLKPDQLMDASLVDELKNSGFIKQIFG